MRVTTAKFFVYGLADPESLLVFYVGKTTQGLRRPRKHLSPSALKDGTRRALWVSEVLARGALPQILVLEEVEVSDVATLSSCEQKWIRICQQKNPLLTNDTDRGSIFRGKKLSAEHKRRLRISAQERYADPAEREKMRQLFVGRVFSAETKAKMSASQKRRMLDNVQRRKFLEARPDNTGKRWSLEQKVALAKKRGATPFVDQFGRRFESVRGASRSLGIDSSCISKVLKGKLLQTKGYRFTYVLEE